MTAIVDSESAAPTTQSERRKPVLVSPIARQPLKEVQVAANTNASATRCRGPLYVSIHAPRVGSDGGYPGKFIKGYGFNPRSP